MIGLGSNRLTVCRRGGMSVTQAGRGGMEWLAGGRIPSWASPYSAQATAALLAQFPTQWPTIRDYGFAHPEIVPYVNANPTMAIFCVTYEGWGDMFLNNANDLSQMAFDLPVIAIDATKDSERMWMMRSPANFTDWTTIPALVAQRDWMYKMGGFSNSNGSWCTKWGGENISSNKTVLRFFVPTQMPSGFCEAYADNLWVYVNGTLIFGKNGGYHANKVAHDYDFSNIINVNGANYIVYAWTGGGGNGADVGLYY